MNETLRQMQVRGEREELPLAVRQYYSQREYEWLTEAQKSELVEANTEPEVE